MLKFLSHAITAVAALARGNIGRPIEKELAPTGAAHRLNALRMWYKRSDVFGTTPPLPDPGGVHAHMMRHRR
jgi:hypothetical protein